MPTNGFLKRWKAADGKKAIVEELELERLPLDPIARGTAQERRSLDLICHVAIDKKHLPGAEWADHVSPLSAALAPAATTAPKSMVKYCLSAIWPHGVFSRRPRLSRGRMGMAQDGFIILRRSVPHGPKPLTLRAQKFLPQVLRTLGARLPESARLEPLAIDLTVTTLSDKEVSDLAEDPDVLATAPSIPISLIKPLATEEAAQAEAEQAARAAGISWGVQAVAKDVGPEAGSGTTVAVLDSGIDRDHPAFAGVALTVKNFSSASSENDVFGHGTHCAGTIFGRDVDGVRIGVARGVRRALIGKILDDNGRGNTAAVAQAIQWAYGQGAQVISLSLGIEFSELVQWLENAGRPRSEALSRALSAYRDSVRLFDSTMQLLGAQSAFAGAGSIVVAAAGNSSSRDGAPPIVIDASLPAAANGVVSVGAIGKSNNGYQIAPFSNRNPMLCAPGVGIVSAKRGGGLTALDGTSMAAPHAAGIAVLWWERAREDALPPTSETVRARLLANCTTSSFAASVAISDRGAGLVQSPPPKPSQG